MTLLGRSHCPIMQGQMLLLHPRRSGMFSRQAPRLAPLRNGRNSVIRRGVGSSSSSSSGGRQEPSGGVSTGVSFASLPISQQSLSMAFQVLDKDEDGRISRSEACRLVAYYLALQHHKPAPVQRRGLTWDQHLLSSINTASKLSGGSWAGVAAACEAYVSVKVAGGLQAHPPRCSDLVWGGLGMATAVLVLGVLATAAQVLPVVGQWHQQGVPLLLGSFGTLAILLFGKPEAEPVRLWSLIAGQVGAAAIVVTVLQVWGANLISRAAAMAATVAWMMWSDCIHPPGGALVLMAMDNTGIQHMSWSYLLWPSLALSLAVLLPISAATNWLRRNYQFDAPWTDASAASLQAKVQEWEQQQAAKQVAVLRQWRALELDRGMDGQQRQQPALHEELHSPLARLARVLRPVLQLLRFPAHVPQLPPQQQRQRQQRPPRGWGVITTSSGERLQVRGINLDLGGVNLGGSITDATPAEQAAAAALEEAIRRRLMQDQDRGREDKLHKRRVWGGYEHNPDLKKVQEKVDGLHQQRMQQEPPQPPAQQQPQDQQQQQQRRRQGPQHGQQGQRDCPPGAGGVISPRQRLEQYWELRAQLADGSRGSGVAGSTEGFRGNSPQLKERQQPEAPSSSGSSGGGSSQKGPTGSFAPDDE